MGGLVKTHENQTLISAVVLRQEAAHPMVAEWFSLGANLILLAIILLVCYWAATNLGGNTGNDRYKYYGPHARH